VLGAADATSVTLAWAYVGLRVVHSLLSGTKDRARDRQLPDGRLH